MKEWLQGKAYRMEGEYRKSITSNDCRSETYPRQQKTGPMLPDLGDTIELRLVPLSIVITAQDILKSLI